MARILVVDDYPVTQRLLTFQLSRRGHRIVTAHSGDSALCALRGGLFDIALIDLAVSPMDGLTIVQHMRADDSLRGVPVIILATGSSEQDRQRAYAAGANGFVAKPADPWQLSALIRDLLLRQEGQSSRALS